MSRDTHRIRFAVRLYPRAWRERYGAEFEALLEQTGLPWRDFANVLLGAVQMQLRYIGFGKIVAVGVLLGLLAGAAALRALPKTYASRAVVRLSYPAASSPFDAVTAMADAQNMSFSRLTLARIIRTDRLYKDRWPTTPMEDIILGMRRAIDIYAVGPAPNAFVVQFRYAEPAQAEQVTGELVARLSADVAASKRGRAVEIVDAPSSPRLPLYPRPAIVLLTGLAGGLALAGAVYLLKRKASRPAA